jgi:protein-S-isoprenylcysteine O-methyltransferase Ste14
MFKYLVLLTVIAVAASNGVHVPSWLYIAYFIVFAVHLIAATVKVSLDRTNNKETK